MTSYLNENEAKIYKMATSILFKFLTLKWDIWRTIWRIEVSDGSFFYIFHALSFELNFFRTEFPFNDLQKECWLLVIQLLLPPTADVSDFLIT